MKFSIGFLFETLLRSLRLLGLQACEGALSKNRDNLFTQRNKIRTPDTKPDQDHQP